MLHQTVLSVELIDPATDNIFDNFLRFSAGQRLIAEPLIRVDKNFVLLPAAAERWESSEDGLTWYFYLRKGLVFSDGRPLTAHDYVYTFRRGADPENAYDFEWYYRMHTVDGVVLPNTYNTTHVCIPPVPFF